jgi:hypothetical protein
MLRSLIAACVVGAGIGVGSVPAYWSIQPDLEFDRPVVNYVEQTQGQSVAMSVPVKIYEQAGDFTLRVSIVDDQKHVVRSFNSETITSDSTYQVLTGAQLPVGTYYVYVVVAYRLNPIRDSNQTFQIAVLKVKGNQ